MARNNRIDQKPSIALVGHSDALMKFLRLVRNKFNLVAPNVTDLADAATTLTQEQSGIVAVANTAAVSHTLPDAADNAGVEFTFVKTTANLFAITVVGTAGGDNSEMDAQYDTITVKSDGTAWYVTAKVIGA